jgi:hypothetical protein
MGGRHESPTDKANEVIRHLVAAAEAMMTPTTERKAVAMIHTMLALVKIAQTDPQLRAFDLVMRELDRRKKDSPDEADHAGTASAHSGESEPPPEEGG